MISRQREKYESSGSASLLTTGAGVAIPWGRPIIIAFLAGTAFLIACAASLPAQGVVSELARWRGDSAGLSRIGGVRLSGGSLVAVGLPQDGAVLVLDRRTGRQVARVGRRGGGPGEIRTLANFGFSVDTLILLDRSLMRMTAFGRDGSVLRTGLVPASLRIEASLPGLERGLQQPRPLGGRMGASFVYRAFAPTGAPPGEPLALHAGSMVVEADRDGRVHRVIGEVPSDGCLLREGSLEVRSPFCWPAQIATSGTAEWIGIAHAEPDGQGASLFVSLWHATTGAHTAIRDVVPTVPRPRTVRDSILRELRQRVPQAARMVDRTSAPSAWPPLQRTVVGLTGHVLVGVRTPSGRDPSWRLYDPSGTLHVTFELPTGFVPHDLSGFTVAGIQSRADGHEDVVIVRVASR